MAEHLQRLLLVAEERVAEEVMKETVNEDQGDQLAAALHQEVQLREPKYSQLEQVTAGVEDREHVPSHICSRDPYSPLQRADSIDHVHGDPDPYSPTPSRGNICL